MMHSGIAPARVVCWVFDGTRGQAKTIRSFARSGRAILANQGRCPVACVRHDDHEGGHVGIRQDIPESGHAS